MLSLSPAKVSRGLKGLTSSATWLKPCSTAAQSLGLTHYSIMQDFSARQTAPQASEPEESQMQEAEGVDVDGQVGNEAVQLHNFKSEKYAAPWSLCRLIVSQEGSSAHTHHKQLAHGGRAGLSCLPLALRS